MVGNKSDIFQEQWLELVFQDRNRSYGAYQLRRENSKTTLLALLTGGILFSVAITAPFVVKLLRSAEVSVNLSLPEERIVEVPVLPIPPKKDPQTAILPPAAPEQKQEPRVTKPQELFTQMVVSPEGQDDPATMEDLKNAEPGSKKLDGDPGAISLEIDTLDRQRGSLEIDMPPVEQEFLEVLPSLNGFYEYFADHYSIPKPALAARVNGTIFLRFIVEKNGSLSDIQVMRDLGYGTGEEAVRVLKNSPAWNPGIQNGHPVRASLIMPVKIKTSK